jgi:cold shock CspA family protein/ribosome-associated translation inhibitor RaiA
MQLPLDITWRGVDPSPNVEGLIRERAAHLERFARQINRCSVAIEKPHEHPQSGSGWRVRVDITLPPGHEVVVVRESWQGSVRDDLHGVVQEVFDTAKRRIRKLSERRRGRVKRHVEQELEAVISRLLPEGYGFVTTSDGREVYFHRNAVLEHDFDDLKVGMGVALAESEGEEGPQASTLRVVDRRGHEPEAPG